MIGKKISILQKPLQWAEIFYQDISHFYLHRCISCIYYLEEVSFFKELSNIEKSPLMIEPEFIILGKELKKVGTL